MKTVNKGIKVRIYPNKKQKEQFHDNFGAVRFIHNGVLERLNNLYKYYPGQYKLNRKLTNTLYMQVKQENSFLYDVESTSLKRSIEDLLKAYNNFFKNPKTNFPKFHSKKNTRLSFAQDGHAKLVQKKRLKLRKYGFIRFRTSKEYTDLLNSEDIKINNITISCDNGKYFVVLNIETSIENWSKTNINKGFDLNSNKNHFLVSNTGEKYSFNVDFESQKIAELNNILSTKQKGSRAFKRIVSRLHKWYDKRTNKLNDFAQKLSTSLVKECDTIVIESNWSGIKVLIGGEQNIVFPTMRFKEMFKYKFDWYKENCNGVVEVNPAFTSKECHVCGSINEELTCDVRIWACENCGSILDRDINAAINILNRWDNGDCLSTRC